MTLTDEQLDALADRLWRAGTASDAGDDPWVPAAREAARWAEEQQGEVVEAIQTALVDHGEHGCAGCTAVDAVLAKHKENTDGR